MPAPARAAVVVVSTIAYLCAVACSAGTATLDLPTADARTPPDAARPDGGAADAGTRDAHVPVRTSSIVIVDEPSLYQFYQVVDGHTVHLPTAMTGCDYPFPFPARVQNTGDTALDGELTVEGSDAFEVVGGALHLEPRQAAAFEVRARGEPVARAEAELVARYEDEDGGEATARRHLTLSIEQGPQVETHVVEAPPVLNVLLVVDGSTTTEAHRGAIVRAVEVGFDALRSGFSGRWAVAYGAPGSPIVVGQGGLELISRPFAVDPILERVDRALTSTRTGDPMGAALDALVRLLPLNDAPWALMVFSAVDGRPGALGRLPGRVRYFDFQVGGGPSCAAPPAPALSADARALGAEPRPVCEAPLPLSGTPGPLTRFRLRHVPDPATIRVEVDGVDVPRTTTDGRETWGWDGLYNRVAFGADPPYGSAVVIRYSRPCADIARFVRR